MTPSFALVESNTSGTGRLFVQAARARGLRTILLTSEPGRYPFVAEDQVETLIVDTNDAAAVIAACRTLTESGGLKGITTSSDYYVVTTAVAARALGLPGSPPEALLACRDKERQRECLTNAGVPGPRFIAAADPHAAGAAAQTLGFPVIVKPVTGSGSVGVRWCADRPAVEAHTHMLLSRSRNERGLPIPARVLIEQVVEGREFSVELLAGTAIGVTAKHLGPLPDFVETGHDFPAQLPASIATEMVACAQRASAALKVQHGPTHTELRWSPQGAMVVEVNPRLAGGFIPEVIRLARGVDLIDQTIALSCGEPLCVAATATGYASVRFILTPGDGKVGRIRGLEIAKRIGTVASVQMYVQPGKEVRRCGDFRDRIGHVIARADDHDSAARAAELACRGIRIEIH